MSISLRTVLAPALVCLLNAGIGVPLSLAQLTLGPPPPLKSMLTDTSTAARPFASTATPIASVLAGSSARQEGPSSKFPVPDTWPAPVNDQEHRLFTLIDVLEYRPSTGGGESTSDYRWDVEGWYGGDYNRLWFKSEGQQDSAFKADYDVDFQLLYGRFIQKYYDFQIGPRVETQSFRGRNVTRGFASIGIQGLVPYSYELEANVFIDEKGNVSGRLTLTKDLLLTQRLILQGRFETNLAVQRVVEFTTGSGLNNLEFGVRLRYEIRREFAPYIGISLDRSFGETATLVRQEGGDPSQVRFVAGVRAWF